MSKDVERVEIFVPNTGDEFILWDIDQNFFKNVYVSYEACEHERIHGNIQLYELIFRNNDGIAYTLVFPTDNERDAYIDEFQIDTYRDYLPGKEHIYYNKYKNIPDEQGIYHGLKLISSASMSVDIDALFSDLDCS